ncbi:cysteinyl-tRNA synthetase [Serendipita vermifera]|nr:cysteinyl-tRNA synthetase [Serendipita vermifera]
MSTETTKWFPPAPTNPRPILKVYNSLTRQKDEFIPSYGNLVKWYNCGPTVYDASHMGHARNYVTQDILRRILEDYFGYDVHLVMNVTDIDDKIILRARHEHLIEQLKQQNSALTQELVDLAHLSWEKYLTNKILNNVAKSELAAQPSHISAQWSYVQARALDPSWAGAAQAKDEKFTMHMNTLEATQSAIELARTQLNTGSTEARNAELLIEASKDVIALELDEKLKETVSDPAIFRRLAAYWETSFMDDMARLRVRPPTTITRATEYVEQMVAFIGKVITNGYAYAGDDGNVWFDKAAFDGASIKNGDLKHEYAKLAPWSRGNKALLAEGEGALTTHSSKRSQEDFALWKASKPGEPSWPSPWGRGRPGWHIECSVMASDIFGERMDIHSGGIDLLFPHHDNELAQSEAYHGNEQWVNYFLHTGHLHIAGLKMSKSLKNFITIDTLLQTWSARQVRLSFLTQLWNNRLDWNESLQAEVRAKETTFDNFFVQTKALVAEWDASPTPENGTMSYTKDENDLTSELYRQQHAFRVALCDSFNTPQALQALTDLVSATNIYLKRGRGATNIYVVRQVASWVTKMLRMFGLGEGVPAEIGWGVASASGEETSNLETALIPYLRALSSFRDEVRKKAKAKEPHTEFLELTDRLRDEDLVPLGVALDDQEDGKALVKLVPPAVLMKARDEKKAAIAAKAAQKEAARAAQQQQQLEKLQKGKLKPEEMFKPPNVPEGTYGSWNEAGLPLTDGEGQELSKGKSKKLMKEQEEQAKKHQAWLAYLSQQGGPSGSSA